MNGSLFSKILNLSRKGVVEETPDKKTTGPILNSFKTSQNVSDNDFLKNNVSSSKNY